MDLGIDKDIMALVSLVVEIGLGLAAYRLATALKGRVDDHETRIVKLEESR